MSFSSRGGQPGLAIIKLLGRVRTALSAVKVTDTKCFSSFSDSHQNSGDKHDAVKWILIPSGEVIYVIFSSKMDFVFL